MAPLAERTVRIRLDSSGFKAELKKTLAGSQFKTYGEQAGKEWAAGFKAAVKAELASAKYKVKVEADWSGFKNPPRAPGVKAPTSGGPSQSNAPASPGAPAKVPVELDPLVGAFQADLRKQLAALSKQVSAQIPVTPETAELRQDLADKIRVLEQQLKVKVPAGPEARGFETDLRALAKEVESQIRIYLPVEPDGAAEAGRRAGTEAKAGASGSKIPIELNPLVAEFQANVRRELTGLRRLSAQIPVNPDTAGLRRDISLRIAVIERGLKIKVPISSDGNSVISGLTGQLGGLKTLLGGALGVAPQGLQALSGGFDALSGSTTRAAGSAGQLGSSLSSMAGPIGTALTIGLVVEAITALPAIALAASGAIIALGGALGSLPALGVGLGASIGVFSLGFEGISDHLKKLPKAGGGAAKSLSQVASANRGLANAQRDLLKATKDIDKARADEIERIDDLGRSLRGAVLDEEDAAAGVAAARTKLAEARASGDVNQIGEADRAYRRSLLTLDEARDKTGDLTAEKAKSDKDGVEGSDQVQQALERQRDAIDRLTAAQEALRDAQKSAGGGAAAQKLKAIAPAAQEVVDMLKKLKPAFEDLRLTVQQKLFEGVAGELQKLSTVWLPQLKTTLGSYAGEFNSLFKNLSASVRKPEFVSNIAAGAESVRRLIDKVGKAITGPFTDAFGRLARAAAPFIGVLGDKLAGIVEHFSAWIKSADESGKLSKFFEDASFYFDKLWDIGGNLVGIFADLFGIFFDTDNQGGAKDYLSGLNEQLIAVRDWLKDPANQAKIKQWIEDFGKFVANAEKLAVWVEQKGLPALTKLMTFFSDAKTKFDEARDGFNRFKDVVTAPLTFTGNMFDGLTTAFRNALNNTIALFNRLNLGLNFSLGGAKIGTAITGIGRKLATGGIARATPGGMQATIAEGGKDEVVSPIDQLQSYVMDAVTTALGANGGGGPIIVEARIYLDGRELKETVVETIAANPNAVAKAAASGDKKRNYVS